MLYIDGLRCAKCGGRLEIGVKRDGLSNLALKYDSAFSPNWEYVVSLECVDCPAVYPICRVNSQKSVSAIIHKKDC
jgi:hypothetical protein